MKKVKVTLTLFVMMLVMLGNIKAQPYPYLPTVPQDAQHPSDATWPTYRMAIANDSLINPNTYEFDVFFKCNSVVNFEIGSFQIGFNFNYSVLNSGVISTPTFTAGNVLPLTPYFTTGTWGTGSNSGAGLLHIKRSANSFPGPGSGYVLGYTDGWIKLVRIKIQNSVAFAQFKPNLSYYLAGSYSGFTKTSLTAYVSGIVKSITTNSPSQTIIDWHINSGLNNPTLNKPIAIKTISVAGSTVTVPASESDLVYYCIKGVDTLVMNGTGSDLNFTNLTAGTYKVTAHRAATYMYADMSNTVDVVDIMAYNVTGGGSYCTGVSPTGVSVGLSNSQTGVDYQLKKGGVNEGSAIAGTGAALAWNNLTAGVYTVEAIKGASTMMMTGSQTVTATALPATPLVSVVNNCGSSTLTITNPEAGATFTWTGGSTVNPLTTTNSGTYTVTQTNGCTSLASADAVAAPKPIPATPIASVMDNCGNSSFDISNLAFGATMSWYNGASLVGTGGNYTVTNIVTLTAVQTLDGCVSASSNAVTSAPIPAVTPSVSIAASLNNVCAGTTVVFTPTPVNGGTTPAYEWFVGAVSQGSSATFSYVPANGDVVSCIMTSAESCVTAATATSNNVTMNVTTAVTPSVSILADLNNVCAGTTVTYTSTPVNGGTNPIYQWKVNGFVSGGLSSFSYMPSNGDVVSLVLTSDLSCVTTSIATSNEITMNVTTAVSPSVSIAADLNNVCAGTTVVFTPTPVNGGATPAYEWFVGAVTQGSSATFSYVPANGDVVSCVMTSAESCVTAATATSNAVTMTVNAPVTPAVTLVSNVNNVCAGTNVTFTATPTVGGSTDYAWYVNGFYSNNGPTNSFSFTPFNGDVVSCIITSDLTCVTSATAASNNVIMTVNALVTPSVTIAPDANNVCAGTTVTLTATPVNGGVPSYQWVVNGVNAGTLVTYSYVPSNGDVVYCEMTSTATCASPVMATSADVNMVVNPLVTPFVAVAADMNNVCSGTTVNFTATPTNGGNPTYQWMVNGNNVGTGLSTYSYIPANGDVVACEMTSDLGCVTSATATNHVIMVVNASLTPAIAIVSDLNNVCAGTTVTFTATPTNGGVPSYNWHVNGNTVGNNAAVYAYAPANGDVVTCLMTSDLGCVTSATASSNALNMVINAIPSAPTVSQVAACGSTVLTASNYTGTLAWSTTASTASITVTNSNTYTVNQTVNGCTSADASIVAAPIAIPAAPVVSVQNNCGNTDLSTTATGSLMWSNAATTSSINVTTAGTYTVTTTVNGCTSLAGSGVAAPIAIPSAPTVSVQNNCDNSVLTAGYWGGTLAWSNGASTPSITVAVQGTYTVTQTVNGCTSAPGTGVATFVAPTAQTIAITASANPSISGSPVSYHAVATPFAGTQTYTWYVNNVAQTSSTTYNFSYIPITGDQVKCIAAPISTCFLGGTSNTIIQVVNPTPNVTNTWLGNSTAWNLATNWSLNMVPLTNHDVVIPGTVANFPIINAAAVCHNINLASGAQLINNSTLAIGGTVTVQQYLDGGYWHYFSSPVNDAVSYALSNANPNNFGQDLYLQYYNESWNGLTGSPWVNITSPTVVLSAGNGYEVYSQYNHTITLSGTQLNSASVTIPLSWSSPNIFLKGYNLIGNPFPSALNVNNSNTWPLANVIPALYLWSQGFGNYLTWDGALTGSLGGIVPANQSFFVVANGPAASYTIPATAKTFGGTFHKSTVNDRLTLDVKGNNYQDQATIRFDANATSNYDSQFDVKKIFGLDEAPQFYSVIQNEILSINALPSLTGVVVVPMALKVGANGTYTITASEMNSFANGTTIMLEDTKTNTFTNLNQQSVYTFTANIADNANRFKVHFGVNGINENNNGNISIYSNKNVIYVNNNSKETVKEIVVMNMLGQQILNKKAANSTVNTITMDVATAYYVVKVVTANKVYTEKVYVK